MIRYRLTAGVAITLLAATMVTQAQTPKPASGKAAPAAQATPAPAPVGTDPASTSATYGDWVVRCQRVGEGDKAQRVCEVAQTLQVQGRQTPVAQIAFGRVAPADPLKLTIALPPNISLPSAVTLTPGEGDVVPFDLAWRRCIPGACVADANPSSDTLKSLRSTTASGTLAFKDAAGRDVVLPFSLRGLAQALDALAKS